MINQVRKASQGKSFEIIKSNEKGPFVLPRCLNMSVLILVCPICENASTAEKLIN